MSDRNISIIEEFRANEGEVGGHFAGRPVLLLTTIGAKTGMERINPLMYLQDGDRYIVFASKAGAHTHPDWYHNLKANPQVRIEVGSAVLDAKAEIVESAERDELYAEQVSRYSWFGEYQEGTSRVIPVVALTPIS